MQIITGLGALMFLSSGLLCLMLSVHLGDAPEEKAADRLGAVLVGILLLTLQALLWMRFGASF